MRAVIIGAGRGSRLGPETDRIPKTLVEVMGRPMLDWILDALAAGGFRREEVVFVCGYAEEAVRSRYPELTFVRNADWERNNILASLLMARDHLLDGFVSTYADIVYEGAIVERLVANPHDYVIGCDTAWRRRYVARSEHPETDAEKLRADGARVIQVSRHLPSEAAQGEFIGVMRLAPPAARRFVAAFEQAQAEYQGRVFREGRPFERAYLIDLVQEQLESGEPIFREDTDGGYMEIDTEQDLALAAGWWRDRP
ncbi:MAG: phosphocholine cytidylyltransferase family protein [Polyangiaceae bacterium]|nr:phosphocholine cytidylyltransferase family protein [Polyangiaceae bacterium]